MNKVFLDLGFIQIKWYSICILIGITVATYLILKESQKKGISNDLIIDILFYGIIFGIIGARVYYVLFNLDYYSSNITEIIKVWNGGLAIHGGIIAGVLFLLYYCHKNKIDFLHLTDILVVGLIIAQSIGRWGNFFNGEAYGRVVSLNYLKSLHLPSFIINGMYIDYAYREPTFLYESVLSLIGFIVLILVRKKRNIKVGTLSGIYLIWYGIERLIIESFRSDSLMLYNIKVAQLVSIVFILIGLLIIYKSTKNNKLYKEEKIFL